MARGTLYKTRTFWRMGFVVIALLCVFLAPRTVKAFPGEAFSAAVWKHAMEILRDIGSKALKATKDVAFKNALNNFTAKVAQDTATYVATGGKGQKPLFLTNPGKYLEDAGNAAAGDFVDSLSKSVFNKSACTFDLTQHINIDKYVRSAITKLTPNFCGERTMGSTEVAQKAYSFFRTLKQSDGGLSVLLDDDYKANTFYSSEWRSAVLDGDFKGDMGKLEILMNNTILPGEGALQYLIPDSGPELEQVKNNMKDNLDYARVVYTTLITSMDGECKRLDGKGNAVGSVPIEKCKAFYRYFTTEYVKLQSEVQARLQSCLTAGIAGSATQSNRCTISQIGRNLDPRRIKASNISQMFDPSQNPLSLLLSSVTDAQDATTKARESAKFEQTASTITGVKSKITGEIKSTKEQVQELDSASKQNANTAEKTYTQTSVADIFFKTFTRTLLSKLISKTFVRGYNPRLDSQITSSFENFIGSDATPAIVASLQVPTIDASEKVDILDEFTTCPTFEPARTVNNCVLDTDFRAAIDEGLTIEQAIKQGKLHPERPFGYIRSGSGDFGRLSEPASPDQGYAASAMKKLRLAGIVNLGWEIAAEQIRTTGVPATLGDVLAGNYDVTLGADGKPHPDEKRFYRLVDSGWLLKAHETSCRARVYGSFLSEPNSKERQQVCVDLQTCVVEDQETGKCKLFGYCTREDSLIYKFPEGSKSCSDTEVSCGAFTDTKGVTSGYLRNKLIAQPATATKLAEPSLYCPTDAGGCKAFINTTDPESSGTNQYLSLNAERCKPEDTNTNKYTRKSDGSVFYLKNAPQCNASEVGCDGYTPTKGGSQLSAVFNEGTDSCPSSCVGLNSFRELNVSDVPTGVIETFIPSTATQCRNDEVGCQEYTNLDKVAQGGEGREYYSALRQCEKPATEGQATFFTWEGLDTAGLKLKSWRLNTVSVDNPSSQCVASPLNLDCKEFIDVSGATHTVLVSKVIVVTDQCAPLRRTSDGGQVTALPSESRQCRGQSVGCTAYLGPTASNIRDIANYDFEDGTVPGGWIGSPITETAPSGLNHAITNQKTIGYVMRQDMIAGATYTITFDAHIVPFSSEVPVWIGVYVNGQKLTTDSGPLTTDWKRFSMLFTAPESINRPTILMYAAHRDYFGAMFVDNFTMTETVEGRATVVKSSWRTPSECTANFARCSEYKSATKNTNVTAYRFNNVCRLEKVGCDAFTKDTGIGASPDTTRYRVNTPTYQGLESAAGCTAFKEGTTDIGIKIVPNPTDATKVIGQCRQEDVGCELFTDENSSKVAFKKPTGARATVAQCNVGVASCTQYKFDPEGDSFDRTFNYVSNTIPKSSTCTTSGPNCLNFKVDTYDTSGSVIHDQHLISISRDRQCSEWLYPKTISPTFDENTRKFRNVVYSIGRCRKADPKDPTVCLDSVGVNEFDYDNVKNSQPPLLDIAAYRRGLSGGLGGKVWDFVGYSLYNQYPVEFLRQLKPTTGSDIAQASSHGSSYQMATNNPTSSAPKNLNVYPSCRAFPESDSPFPAGEVLNGQTVTNPLFDKANLYEDGQGNKNECAYRKLTYDRFNLISKYYNPDTLDNSKICVGGTEVGKACIADNQCGGDGRCSGAQKIAEFNGWRGYCLEPDISKPINGTKDQYACSTWYPVDLIKGEVDVFNNHPEAGIKPENNYYCLQGETNAQMNLQFKNQNCSADQERERKPQCVSNEVVRALTGGDRVNLNVLSVNSSAVNGTDYQRPMGEVSAIELQVAGENHNNEWPTNLVFTPDKVARGTVERHDAIYDKKISGSIYYKYDTYTNPSDNTVEWRVYPVDEDGTVPPSITPTDLGSYSATVPDICKKISDATNVNCVWGAVVFDGKESQSKIIKVKFAGMDNGGNNFEDVAYKYVLSRNLACSVIAKVEAPYTNRILNTKLNTTVRDIGYNRETERIRAKGGAGFGQMALDISPRHGSMFYLRRDGVSGSPYSCTGECVSTPESLWPTIPLNAGYRNSSQCGVGSLAGDLRLCVAADRLKSLFARFFITRGAGQYGPFDPSSLVDDTVSGELPIIDAAVLKERTPSSEVYCKGKALGVCTDADPNNLDGRDTFTINDNVTSNPLLTISKSAQTGVFPTVTIIFYAYNKNGEQLPIKGILVDWGDGSQDGETDRGNFRNKKSICDSSGTGNWGDSKDACDTIPWKFTHDFGYDGTGRNNFTISVMATDNWGRQKIVRRGIVFR